MHQTQLVELNDVETTNCILRQSYGTTCECIFVGQLMYALV
jgi:hypothetical protein